MGGRAGGRKPDGTEAKRAPLNLRTSPELRDRLEQAASKTGNSLTQEVEKRLLLSFGADDIMGGAHTNALLRVLHAAIAQIEAHTGTSWQDDVPSFHAVKAAHERILHANRPLTPAQDPLNAALIDLHDAESAEAEALAHVKAVEPAEQVPRLGPPGMYPAPVLSPSQRTERERLLKRLEITQAKKQKAQDAVMAIVLPRADRQRAAVAAGVEIADNELRVFGSKRAK